MNDHWTATSLRDPPGVIGGVQLPIDASSPRSYDVGSARVGGYIGYNWQFAPKWVGGVEIDAAWANATSTKGGFPGCSPPGAGTGCVAGFGYAPGGPFGGDTTSVSMRADGSARARVGFLTTPDALLYGTGGVAWQNIQSGGNCGPLASSSYCNSNPLLAPIVPTSITQSATLVGWTAGGGVEVHTWGNWLVRVEYRYANFGTRSNVFAFGSSPAGSNTYRFQLNPSINIGTVGLAYKF